MAAANRILTFAPVMRSLGVACFQGAELVDYGVKSLRLLPKQRLEVACDIVKRYVEETRPGVLVLLAPKVARGLHDNDSFTLRIRRFCQSQRLPFYVLTRPVVSTVLGLGERASQRQLARMVCSYYPELNFYRKKVAPWSRRYYAPMFSAVATGLAHIQLAKSRRLTNATLAQ